jgi:uncharacterized protein (TIGR03067 family)
MRDDLKLLQGTWTIASLKVDGQEMSNSMFADAQVVVKGDRFTTTGMGSCLQRPVDARCRLPILRKSI